MSIFCRKISFLLLHLHAASALSMRAVACRRAIVVSLVDASERTWQTTTVAPGRTTLDKSGGEYTLEDLKAQASALNPIVGYFDPLGLGDIVLFEESKEASLGFVRQAEIKHGRVAMAGFVGYLVHENGIRWPFPLTLADAAKGRTDWYADYEGLSAPDVWDKIPLTAKLQIIAVIGFLEIFSERVGQSPTEAANGKAHYMRGGQPGYFPSLKAYGAPFDLWIPIAELNPRAADPKNNTPELKKKRLLMELNNGRLAMIGLFGLLAEAKVPGATPLVREWFGASLKPYAGEVMFPFGPNWAGEIAAFGFGS